VSVSETIHRKVSSLPHKPGIYLMKDRFGTVIYVGKARDLRKRVSHYFQPARRLGWDLRFKALVEAIHDFDFHTVRANRRRSCSKASSSRNSIRATTSVSATTNGF